VASKLAWRQLHTSRLCRHSTPMLQGPGSYVVGACRRGKAVCMDERPSWRPCVARPAPAEVAAIIRARVVGESWKDVAETDSAAVDALPTPSRDRHWRSVRPSHCGELSVCGRCFNARRAVRNRSWWDGCLHNSPREPRLLRKGLRNEVRVAGRLTEQHNESSKAGPADQGVFASEPYYSPYCLPLGPG
jgi:hypothetical protein